ncbi:hypothetical protein ABEF93_007214 [Exophiala dermatitidis]
MFLSSRANPPKPLRLGGGGSSERYLSIKSLLPSTPIPSPSLPSILPRHGKKPPKLNSRRIVRGLLWLSLLIGVYYLARSGNAPKPGFTDLSSSTSRGRVHEIVDAAKTNVPKHATPVIVTDSKGKQQYWTISIPPGLGFPLSSTEYADICSQAEQVARQVAGRHGGSKLIHGHDAYMQSDPNYVDVEEAQTRNLLPKDATVSASAAATSGHILSTTKLNDDLPICSRSLTYVLDATDAGLGSALLGMWLSYGLAAQENGTFFIDDTFFPYGNYSTFFSTNTTTTTASGQSCRPPPPSQRVPCLRQARHLVVTGATTRWIFGDAFHQHYTQRQIFDMARKGYEALFKLRDDDAEYVRSRAEKLRSRGGGGSSPSALPSVRVNGRGYLELNDNSDNKNGLLGIHIRRGDRHPLESAYRLSYLPPDRYMAAARRLVGQSEQWTILLASDDPDMYDHPALADSVVRAQQRISLASKKKLGDGGLGWEGGFFKDVFWSLGLPAHVENERHVGSPAPTKKANGDAHQQQRPKEYDHSSLSPVRDYKTNPTEEALKLRELLGRAYLLDLAMLAQSDKVVCGVSSNACRILAVMLGWDRAFENKNWINVDDGDSGGGSGGGHVDYGWSVFNY